MANQVSVSDSIYNKLQEMAKEADFKTTDEYVEYILKQVIEKLEEESKEHEETYSEEDEERVKERLKALGYLQ